MRKKWCLFFYLSAVLQQAVCQDIEKILTAEWLQTSGAVSFSTNCRKYNNTSDINYLIAGNLNSTVKGWLIPLSFNYSNHNFYHNNPFNGFQIAPSYKWFHSYFGTTYMSFSPYTLNDVPINGIGIMLTPDRNFNVAAIAGEIKKENTANHSLFNQNAWGIKFDYDFKNTSAGIAIFHAKDKADLNYSDSNLQSPMANTAINIYATTKLKTLTFSINGSISEICTNIYSERTQQYSDFSTLTGIFMPHTLSSAIYNAIKLSAAYKWINITYEKTAPGYQTFGNAYTPNDIEIFSLGITKKWKKFNFFSCVGIQHNDLYNEKNNKMRNIMLNINAAYNISNRFLVQTGYSNFHSRTQQKVFFNNPADIEHPPFSNIIQNAENADLHASYQWVSKNNIKNNFSYSLSFQSFSDNLTVINNNKLISQSLLLTNATKTNKNYGISVSSFFQKTTSNQSGIGGTIFFATPLFDENFKTRYTIACNKNINSRITQNTTISLRFNTSYNWKKKHSFSSGIDYSIQDKQQTINALFNYSYTF